MNVLIVEDELHTSKLLKEIIEQDEDFLVTERLESVAEAVQYLSKHQQKLDLIFLDIQLADGHSFEIFNHIDVTVPVVFCTAYDEYTLQAIKNNGIDYILKPFKEEDIHAALNKYKRLAQTFRDKSATPLQFPAITQYQQSFLTQYRDKTLVKYVKEIALFYIEFETVYMYTINGDKSPLFKNLEYIESVCDPKQFFRINRQVLINKEAVLSIEPYFNRKVIVQTKFGLSEKLIVSRLKVAAFKDWLES
ncbi:LytR/AlgR family response regulator transcription factor [Epilithonimonas hungarica]|uniref:Two component transcriptional regulator, LytTR family n=1 Tax=Epilithonimonas hungarica TaxID=454006 RepID=A0A1G7QZC7_9FLAO|nr:LytTR family DNA-binding domain-containing protein [Epilithonimonas hungarica]SDG03863.1 two component transcriptional regulator, LytTR family [Epilithonimonas hungarica]